MAKIDLAGIQVDEKVHKQVFDELIQYLSNEARKEKKDRIIDRITIDQLIKDKELEFLAKLGGE